MMLIIPEIFSAGGLVCALAITYVAWQCLLRLQKRNSLTEPPVLPYWVPGVGHTLAFVSNFHDTLVGARKYFKNKLTPFSIVIAGRKTYVVLDPKLVAETYKKTRDLSYDVFVDQVIATTGTSTLARNTLWSATVDDTKLSVPNSIRAWVRQDFQRGLASKPLYANLLEQVHQALSVDDGPRPSSCFADSVRKKVGQTGQVSLLDWTGDTVVTAFTNALFGRACLDNCPQMLGAFNQFNRRAWKVLFRYPRCLGKAPHIGKDAVVSGLTQYFDLPPEKRTDSAEFLRKSETEMRAHGIASEDIAPVLFNIYWALNGNPSLLAFWLLCHILYNPALLSDIREETAKAFVDNDKRSAPDVSVLCGQCPKLNAAYHEALRIYGGASTFRRVVQDTLIGGYTFKAGSDVMMPYRQLHLDQGYWGSDAEQYNIDHFLDKPEAVSSKIYKAFGGGVTHCPGRFLAQEALLSYIAIALNRYDFEIVGGLSTQRFPRMETKKPTLGIVAPLSGEDVEVIVTSVI